jgi:hypothetical protein
MLASYVTQYYKSRIVSYNIKVRVLSRIRGCVNNNCGSRFDDWVYWHFFKIKVDYNSSHIELLLDNESPTVFLLVLGLISSLQSLEFFIWISDSRTELSQSQSYVTTDGQSASLSWNKAPIWGLQPDFYYCQTIAGLLMWGALSNERTGLFFAISAGPRQRSYSSVRVPWDSQPRILLSQIRDFPLSSFPTTRRATVEVFDPASTQDGLN